jgi:L-alanine-DL-glutamate epimerase-like enolase superfamily enzyme
VPIVNGFFELSDRPGLGFDVKEDVLRKHPGIRQRPTDRPFYI